MKYFLICLCILCDIGYIFCKERNANILGLIFKASASLSFVVLAWPINNIFESSFHISMFTGLLFDALGDLFLAIKNITKTRKMFLIGTFCFMIGHLLYISALIDINAYKPYIYPYITGGLISGIIVAYIQIRICKPTKSLKIVGLVYCLIIFIMLGLAICTYINHYSLATLMYMVGAFMFLCSDMILIPYNYSIRKKWMHPIYSLLYFVGQILISLSLNL